MKNPFKKTLKKRLKELQERRKVLLMVKKKVTDEIKVDLKEIHRIKETKC